MDERNVSQGREIDLLTSEVDFPQAGQSLTSIIASTSVSSELKKLKIRTRNQVRAILASSENDSLRLFNKLRKKSSAKELLQIERVLRAQQKNEWTIIPELFPASPQTKESYHRLGPISIAKHLEIVDDLLPFD